MISRWNNRTRVCMTFLVICTLSTHVAAQVGTPAQVQPKIALLIGNWDYDENKIFTEKKDAPPDRLTDLRNPCNDIELIEAHLIASGWSKENIIKACNAQKKDMLTLIEDFTQRYMLSSQAFGFIYYAGHGVQIDHDTYIFGVDTKVDINNTLSIFNARGSAANLFKGGIRLRQEVLSNIGAVGSGTIFIVLDACRENPLMPLLRQTISGALISAPSAGPTPQPMPGMKYLFSTADGQLADDGAGGNSPFALSFAGQLTNGVSVDVTIRKVVYDVFDRTRVTHLPQVPEESGTLRPPPPEICFGNC